MDNVQQAPPEPQEPQMRAEYDFIGGQRGRYAHLFPKTARAVALAPDVAAVSPDTDSVNAARHLLVKVARQSVQTEPDNEREAA